MDSILFYGDRGEATRRQVRSAAASHSHRIGPRKAKAGKKPKGVDPAPPARKKKLQACVVAPSKFLIDKTARPQSVSSLEAEDAIKDKTKWTEVQPPRQEALPGSTAASLDNDFNRRSGRIILDTPRSEQQSYVRSRLPSIKSDTSSPSPNVHSPSFAHSPRSDPRYQYSRHDSAADPLTITRLRPQADAPRYERSFDGRLHLVTTLSTSPSQSHSIPPALRMLPEPRFLTSLTTQCPELAVDRGTRTSWSSSGYKDDDSRLPMSSGG